MSLRTLPWKLMVVLVSVAVVLAGVRLALEARKFSLDYGPALPVLAAQRFSGPPPNAQGAEYVVDFHRLQPDQWPGSTRIVNAGEATQPPIVQDGRLMQGVALTSQAASYFERRFADDIFRIGITAEFSPPSTEDSAVAMIIADGPLPDFASPHPNRPNAAVHFVATRKGWEVTVWPSDGKPDRIAAEAFNADAFRGPLRFEIRRVGSSIKIISPDGTTVKVDDERIARMAGPWACWDLFQRGKGVKSAAIAEMWAQ
jgi:hypothetical protein